MQLGDFTKLAKDYIHRTGYSPTALKVLASHVGAQREGFRVADVGAGTGKLTENLIALGFQGYAVEPNDAMRAEGMRLCGQSSQFVWSAGSGEATGLPDASVDWVFMASSFHWTDTALALKEFRRILKPGGYFTALWNPRHLEKNPLHQQLERRIYEIAPHIKRVSSGSSDFTSRLDEILLASGEFGDLVYVEAPHEVVMEKERYLGAWRSVNDIQAQAGPEKWQQIMAALEEEVADREFISVPYRTRAWTVRAMEQ